MKATLKKLNMVFAAGSFGACVNSLVFILLAKTGIIAACGIALTPAFTIQWFYPRVVWGGLWGFLFLIPILPENPKSRGLLYSLAPTLTQLFYFFPLNLEAGMLGLKLGALTPALVFTVNAVWGLSTALWIQAARE